jgi:hypothetical protein
MREKEMNRKYQFEFWLAMGAYVIVILGATSIAKDMSASPLRTMIALTPLIPCAAALWVIIRHFGRMDEYLRVWAMENLAIAGAIIAMFGITYGFLEGLDFPKLTGFVYYGIYMCSWGLVTCIRKYLER